MPKRPTTRRNLGLAFLALFLWAALHYLFLILQWDRQLFKLDLLFMVLPPIAAFFLNWYWLRDEHPNELMKSVLTWVAIDLVTCILLILLLSAPLHRALSMLQENASAHPTPPTSPDQNSA